MPVPMRNQMQLRLLRLLHLLPTVTRELELEPQRGPARSSSLVLVHQTLIALRLVVDSRVENAQVRLLLKSEMEDVGLGMHSPTITQRRHCRDGDWGGEVLHTCEEGLE